MRILLPATHHGWRFFTLKVSFLFIALLLVSHFPAHADALVQPRLIVGYAEFAPVIYSDAQQRARGPMADLTRRVAQRAGYRAQFRALPSARLYAALQNGNIDLWVGTPGKPELAAHTLESQQTLGHAQLNLYFRPDTPAPRLPEGLTGQGVIVIGGHSYWPAVTQLLHDPALKVRLLRTSNHESALQMLRYRRADFLLDYGLSVDLMRERLQLDELPFLPIGATPIHFIVSRHTRDSAAVLAALDKAYAELRDAGEDVSVTGAASAPATARVALPAR